MLRGSGGRRARRMTLVGGACIAACLLASCGGSEGKSADQKKQIEVAVRDLQRAFAAEDAERFCALLSRAARKHVESMGHGKTGPPCYFDVYMFIEGVWKSPRWRQQIMREVSDVVVDGDRAKATVEFGDGQTASLPLVHERGRWRVDALYGGMPAARHEDHY